MTTETAPLKIYPSMCEQQLSDLNMLLRSIDEFGATTLALANQGPHGYVSFIEARDTLRGMLRETCKNYRYVG